MITHDRAVSMAKPHHRQRASDPIVPRQPAGVPIEQRYELGLMDARHLQAGTAAQGPTKAR